MIDNFIAIDTKALTPEYDGPAPEKIIEGSPKFTTWLAETRDDERQYTGVWQSTPGKWRISYDEWEFCSILEGKSRLTAKDGTVVEVAAGDSFVLQPGFEGSWEVIETTKKLFVIRL